MTYTMEEHMHQEEESSEEEGDEEALKQDTPCARFLISPHNERKQKYEDFISVIALVDMFISIYE